MIASYKPPEIVILMLKCHRHVKKHSALIELEKFLRVPCAAIFLLFISLHAFAAPLADAQANDRVISARRQQILALELTKPFPGLNADAASDTFDLGHLNVSLAGFETAALEANSSPLTIATANDRLADVLRLLMGQPIYKGVTSPPHRGRPADDDLFHFEISQYLFRIYNMFGPSGVSKRGVLTNDNASRLIAIFFDWARSNCQISDPRSLETWVIWGSENHGALRDSSCWSAASLLSDNPSFSNKVYNDGSTATEQLTAWTQFLRKYLSERAEHGVLIEYFSPTYAQYTLTNFYLYYDFSKDPKLKRLAKASLDLWWALWAQEAINGIHGGSKTRTYAKTIPDGSPMPTSAWLYFGVGPRPRLLPPGESAAIASSYRPPTIVADLALDMESRGRYDVLTRAPGLAEYPFGAEHLYHVDSQHNGILRIARVTPNFVMGLGMLPLLPTKKWTAISDQNRWAGLVLAGGDPLARVVPTIKFPDNRKNYNALFGVQSGGTQLVRNILPPNSKTMGQLEVWFGKPLRHSETKGWVFTDGAAYVAVRPATGGWHWDTAQPQWMIIDDPYTAVIMQAAEKADYPDLAAFIAAVAELDIRVSSDMISVVGLGNAGMLSLGLGKSGLMQVNGHDVDLQPPFVFKSPFINEGIGGKTVLIKVGERELALDFTD
jgi:hypothetical protein